MPLCVKENQANLREQLVEAFGATSLKHAQKCDYARSMTEFLQP